MLLKWHNTILMTSTISFCCRDTCIITAVCFWIQDRCWCIHMRILSSVLPFPSITNHHKRRETGRLICIATRRLWNYKERLCSISDLHSKHLAYFHFKQIYALTSIQPQLFVQERFHANIKITTAQLVILSSSLFQFHIYVGKKKPTNFVLRHE